MLNIPSARHATQWHEIVASVFVCTEHLAEAEDAMTEHIAPGQLDAVDRREIPPVRMGGRRSRQRLRGQPMATETPTNCPYSDQEYTPDRLDSSDQLD